MMLFALVLCVMVAVLPAIATNVPDDTSLVTIDFSELPDGSPLSGGMYLHDEWQDAYGLLLSASGGLSDRPRLFDSSHPGTKKRGDPDLGSPNERCGGPGRGEGGEPDAVGANCKPLGNVLIIQEDNDFPDIPDDNVDGGIISLHFDKPTRVKEMGLLDIDYKSFLRVKTFKSSKRASFDIPIPMLGDNSAQTIKINKDNVIQIDLYLRRSGAIAFFSFYYIDTDLLRIGQICGRHDSCETGYCFTAVGPHGGLAPVGLCSCDPVTNEGCVEQQQCGFSPLEEFAPPECFLPTGATCSSDSGCLSKHCVNEKCACNPVTNVPCAATEVCKYQDEDIYLCLLKTGEPCYGGGCETGYCFNAVLPDGTRPAGVCSCSPRTNEGCLEVGEECAFSPLGDIGPPKCFRPMGERCLSNTECVSDHCFKKRCVCNEDLNFPCVDDETCTFEEGSGFSCQKPLKEIGDECLSGTECKTDYCWNYGAPITPEYPGKCRCNPHTNEGCSDGRECLWPTLPGSSPTCALSAGAPCINDGDCYSGSCVDNICAACNDETNYPCYYDDICVPDEDAERGYNCLSRGDGEVGDECLSDTECKNAYCWNHGAPITPESPGRCSCNPHTNEGCLDDRECLWPTLPGSSPICTLSTGAACVHGSDCYSGSCVDNICTVCNKETNYPCHPDYICVPDEDAEDGYDCRLKDLSVVGDSCNQSRDCLTDICWREYPPNSPGVCVCDPDTNEGCNGIEVCTTHPDSFNEPPLCYLPMGAECTDDSDCLSDSCTGSVCTCNEHTNYPCFENEVCRFDDTEYPYTYNCEPCAIPDPIPEGGCPVDIPVICDGCQYENECLASSASYNVRRDCRRYSNGFESGQDPFRLYKAFDDPEITWYDARGNIILLARKCNMVAHLATITSAEEDIFLHELGRAIHGYEPNYYRGFWVGGLQLRSNHGFQEPGGGWEWVAGEGPISTPTHPIDGTYENWGPREPNDFRHNPRNPMNLSEDQMSICRFDNSAAKDAGKATGWNDEFPKGNRGYIVEVELDDITVHIHSCDTGVENLRLPSPKECPPGQISNLITGCMGYNQDSELYQCVTHIAVELKRANIITDEEWNRIIGCF